MKRFEGKVVVVTGSGQGIGRGIALYFARNGAAIVTNNRKPLDMNKVRASYADLPEAEQEKLIAMRGDAQTTADQIRKEGGQAVLCYADVSKADDAKRLIDTAISAFGRIDILVNNAAGLGQGTVLSTTEAQWDMMTQAKMKGAFLTMHNAVPYMIKQGGGTILNSASDAWVGISNLCAYSAGNAGIVGLTKSAAEELLQYNITVNAYCPQAASPGHEVEFTKTVNTLTKASGETLDPKKLASINRQHGDPIYLAPFLGYLCTKDCSDITGQVFGVTAGGRIEFYSDSRVIDRIEKDEGHWTIEELAKELPGTLLKTVRSQPAHNTWASDTDKTPEAEDTPATNGASGDTFISPEAALFGPGEPAPEDKFHGKAYLNMILGFNHPSHCSVGAVTLGPGAHNNWHTHFGYQVLLVTDGEGCYQEKGGPVRKLKKGDVVVVKPGVEHWHGAAPGKWFSHVGMILNETKPTEGGPEITPEEYEKLTKGI